MKNKPIPIEKLKFYRQKIADYEHIIHKKIVPDIYEGKASYNGAYCRYHAKLNHWRQLVNNYCLTDDQVIALITSRFSNDNFLLEEIDVSRKISTVDMFVFYYKDIDKNNYTLEVKRYRTSMSWQISLLKNGRTLETIYRGNTTVPELDEELILRTIKEFYQELFKEIVSMPIKTEAIKLLKLFRYEQIKES